MAWWVYMLRCRDGSLYTGVTTDVERRFAQHRSGTGAKYTRAHPQLAIKGLRREAKLRLIDRAGAAPGTPDSR